MFYSNKFRKFKNIKHCFFSRKNGYSTGLYESLNCGFGSNDKVDNILKNLELVSKHFNIEKENLKLMTQTHSNKVIFIDDSNKNKEKFNSDALVTKEKNLVLGVLTADCVPIILYDVKNEIIGVIHAGWKGSLSGIIANTIKVFSKINSENNIYACVGPCIGKKSYEVEKKFYADGKLIYNDELIDRMGITSQSEYESIINDLYSNQIINLEFVVVDTVNKNCIKNSSYYSIYRIIPKLFDYLGNLKSQGLNLASSVKINPFIYGETSISNLVKRPPINYFFKTLLYASIVLMVLYWINFNRVFKNIFNQKKNIFFTLGILSAFFLFFHILFLGSTIENELFKKARRLIIILFILFELLAQIFLAKQLFNKRDLLVKYCHKSIILIKIIFVSIIVLVSSVIILILIFANLPSNIDYILEWNYFLILLIFYFLSSIMWKSKI